MANEVTFELDTKIGRAPDMMVREIDGDIIILSIETGKYYGSTTVGSRIWDIIEEPATIAEVCETLENEFEVEHDACVEQVLRYAQQLHSAGIIEVK